MKQHFEEARRLLDTFIADPENFKKIDAAGQLIVNSLAKGNKIISCGNGGSMCDAMHFAEELAGKYRLDRPPLAAMSISDPSYLSCVGNDYGYDFVFSRMVEAIGTAGDVLLAISTSGQSKNVLHAIETARTKKIMVIGLTGNDGGKMAEACDIEIRAPHAPYADRIQELHIKVIHTLIDYVEQHLLNV